MPISRKSLLQAASEASQSAKEIAKQILDSDLAQLAMIVTTIVGAVTYGWIEGAVIVEPCTRTVCPIMGTEAMWFLGHFSTYSIAIGLLFALITGGFGLVKARSMFAKGRRYFLFTFLGNYPLSWMLEDFAFFFFSPSKQPTDRLNPNSWTNWGLGGLSVNDPWRSGVALWIPTWYFIVFLAWLASMWIAHRCTVYDNLVKDQIAREIIPQTIQIPRVVKPVEPESADHPVARETKAPETQVAPETASRPRSPEAEEALRKLREKWMRKNSE